jgi:hypothetical protein
VQGDALKAPYSAPSAGPPLHEVYDVTQRVFLGLGTHESFSPTRRRFVFGCRWRRIHLATKWLLYLMIITTIPCLPCESLDQTLDFWQALGFEVTYRQKTPNPYGVIERDGYALHFFGLKRLPPKDNFGTCLVIVPDVQSMHAAFAECLRNAFGKVPAQGFPRISRMRPAQTRFTLTDNAGNSVIYIKRGGEDEVAAQAYKQPGQTPLGRAVNLAARLRDFHNDDAMAAKVLDDALARHPEATALDRARALAAGIELAIAMGDSQRLNDLRAELERLPLSPDERQ